MGQATAAATTSVTIVGPNLPTQAKATFHVHAAGCADLKRGWIGRCAAAPDSRGWTIDVADRLAVESAVYDFAPSETPDYVLGQYQSEFHFAPCLDSLPLGDEPTAPAPAKPTVDDGQYELLTKIGRVANEVRRHAEFVQGDVDRVLTMLGRGIAPDGRSMSAADLLQSQGQLVALVEIAGAMFHTSEFSGVVNAVIAGASVRSLVELEGR